MKRKVGARFLVNILIGVGVIGLCHWLTGTPFGASSLNSYTDRIIYTDALEAVDAYLASVGAPDSPDGPGASVQEQAGPDAPPPVRFLDIDDETREEWGDPLLTPRDKLADVVEAADEAGVKVLVLDVLLDRPSLDPQADQSLRAALEGLAARNSPMKVVLAAPPRRSKRAATVLNDLASTYPRCYVGAAEVLASGSDKTVRDIAFMRHFQDGEGTPRLVWSMPFLATMLYYDAEAQLPDLEAKVLKEARRTPPERVRLSAPKPWRPSETLVIGSGGSITDRIRFRLVPPGVFKTKGKSNLLLGERFQYKQLPFVADDLKGSILIVGNSFEGSGDLHETPVGDMPGLYVLGNTINTLAGDYQLKAIPSPLLWTVEILSLLAFAYWLPLKRKSLEALCSMALFGVQVGVYFALMQWNIFIDNTFMFFGTSLYLFTIGVLDDLIDLYKWLTERNAKCEE